MTTALEGYGVLVTGGGSGIGEGCALALARDGAVVTICGRTADKLDAAAARIRNAVDGAGVHTITADVTDEAQVEAAVAKAAKEAGALHGVVASAGGSLHMGPLVLADVEAVRATLDLNVIGHVPHAQAQRTAAGEDEGIVRRHLLARRASTRSASSGRTAPRSRGSTTSCGSRPTSSARHACA